MDVWAISQVKDSIRILDLLSNLGFILVNPVVPVIQLQAYIKTTDQGTCYCVYNDSVGEWYQIDDPLEDDLWCVSGTVDDFIHSVTRLAKRYYKQV